MSRPPRASQAKLIDIAAVSGTDAVPIGKASFHIGRTQENDLVIAESTVSSRHAVIENTPEGFLLTDLGSTNGTLLNNRRLEPHIAQRLSDGDKIVLDTFGFEFRLERDAAPAAAPMPDSASRSNGHPVARDGNRQGHRQGRERTDPTRPPAMATVGHGAGAPGTSPRIGTTPPAAAPPVPEIDGRSAAAGVAQRQGESSPADSALPASGLAAIGQYQTLALLGKGGFGSVWKAKDRSGNLVAIKLLNPEALENQRAVRKFFHEAIILSKLDHPHICRFIDFFPHEDNYAIVMDFVEGADLKTLIRETAGPLPLETACRIAAQILDAFDYAHGQNVLHRDIKPENIIWDTSGNARVMDFGIAKLSSSETQRTSVFMISTGYTAPERFDVHASVDHRSDIYSLGLVFYEMFTGAHPFKCTSPTEMIFAHLNVMPAAPADIADVPEAISSAIVTAIEKAPQDRFDSFAAFRKAMFGHQATALACLPPHRGSLAFAEDRIGPALSLLAALLGAARKHQDRARQMCLTQDGDRLELVIQTADGKELRLTRTID